MNPMIDDPSPPLLNSAQSAYLEQLIEGQARIMEMIFKGEDLVSLLTEIVQWAEQESREGMLASILLMDEKGERLLHGAAPSLPEEYNNNIHGTYIGPAVGSCGTAAFTRRQVIAEDIREDILWKDYQHLANAHGLRACWSTPLIARDGKVLGTFAMYYKKANRPTPHDLRIIQLISYTTVIAIEWTRTAAEKEAALAKEKKDAEKLKEEWREFYNTLMNAPAMVAILKGPDHVFELANPIYMQAVGPERNIVGKSLQTALPELTSQGFIELLDNVYATAAPYYGNEVKVRLNKKGKGQLEDAYFNFIYQPILNNEGKSEGIFVYAVEITELVAARKRAEESEKRFRSFVLNSPSPIGIYVGREMRIETANDAILKAWEKDGGVVGKTFREALPELEGQPFYDILDKVYTSGIAYHAKDEKVYLLRNGKSTATYWNFSYTPLRNEKGEVYGVMNTATEVTELVNAKKNLLAAEESLRSAIDIGGLATWSVNLQTNCISYDNVMAHWYGLPENTVPMKVVLERIHEESREQVLRSFREALVNSGLYEAEFRIIHPVTGRERILYAKGKVINDETGVPILVNGINRDITLQRETEKELTRKVELRTQELQKANAELNILNENLKQFAYVASHDLQEPLRKINMFSDILQEKATGRMNEEQLMYLAKISRAAKRMSSLIQDLLDFSRAEVKDNSFVTTDLNNVVKSVIEDYELLLHQKEANIDVADLPVLPAIPLQMNQLFYNLVGNALKFSRKDIPPVVTINCRTLNKVTVLNDERLDPKLQYAEIVISDNGIGFDQQFSDQIFVIFQRLHGKFEYEGTGIGLALCKRIVENHNGVIYARGEKGHGASFHIILPLSR